MLNQKTLQFFGGKDTPTNRYNDLVTVLFRFSLPNIDDEFFPWELQRSSDFAKVGRLRAPLDHSKLLQQSKKARRELILSAFSKQESAAAKVEAAAQPTRRLMHKVVKEVVKVDGSNVVLTLQEDILEAIQSTLDDVNDEQVDKEVVFRAYALMLRYAINESVTSSAYALDSNTVVYSRCPEVRHAARNYVARHHGVALNLSDNSLRDSLDETAQLEQNIAAATEDDHLVESRLEIVRSILRVADGIDHVRLLKAVVPTLANNPEPDEGEDNFNTDHHISFVTSSRQHAKSLRDNRGKFLCEASGAEAALERGVRHVVKSAVEQVGNQIDFRLVSMAALVNEYIDTDASLADLTAAHQTCADIVKAFNEDHSSLVWMTKLRPLHVLKVLKRTYSTLSSIEGVPSLNLVRDCFQRVSECRISRHAAETLFEYDLQTESIDELVNVWTKFCLRTEELVGGEFNASSFEAWDEKRKAYKNQMMSHKHHELVKRVDALDPFHRVATAKLMNKDQLSTLLAKVYIDGLQAEENKVKESWASSCEWIIGNGVVVQNDEEEAEEVQTQTKLLQRCAAVVKTPLDRAVDASRELCSLLERELRTFHVQHPDAGVQNILLEKGKAGKKLFVLLPQTIEADGEATLVVNIPMLVAPQIDDITLNYAGDVKWTASVSGSTIKGPKVFLGDAELWSTKVFFFLAPSSEMAAGNASKSRAWSVQRMKVNDKNKPGRVGGSSKTNPTMNSHEVEFSVTIADKFLKDNAEDASATQMKFKRTYLKGDGMACVLRGNDKKAEDVIESIELDRRAFQWELFNDKDKLGLKAGRKRKQLEKDFLRSSDQAQGIDDEVVELMKDEARSQSLAIKHLLR